MTRYEFTGVKTLQNLQGYLGSAEKLAYPLIFTVILSFVTFSLDEKSNQRKSRLRHGGHLFEKCYEFAPLH
jgi:hypothetical protein